MHPLFSAFTSGYGSGKIIEMTKVTVKYTVTFCLPQPKCSFFPAVCQVVCSHCRWCGLFDYSCMQHL